MDSVRFCRGRWMHPLHARIAQLSETYEFMRQCQDLGLKITLHKYVPFNIRVLTGILKEQIRKSGIPLERQISNEVIKSLEFSELRPPFGSIYDFGAGVQEERKVNGVYFQLDLLSRQEFGSATVESNEIEYFNRQVSSNTVAFVENEKWNDSKPGKKYKIFIEHVSSHLMRELKINNLDVKTPRTHYRLKYESEPEKIRQIDQIDTAQQLESQLVDVLNSI